MTIDFVPKTICKTCVFAKFDGKTQTGCNLKRLHTFSINGASLLEAYDEDKNFFVIEGRYCNAFRPTDVWNKPNPIEAVRDEIRVRPTVFIYTPKNSNYISTLESCFHSEILPAKIVIVLHANHIVMDVIPILKEKCEKHNIEWMVQEVYDPDLSPVNSVDLVVRKEPLNTFGCILKAGKSLDNTLFTKFDHAINDDLKQIIVCKPRQGYHQLIIHNIVWSKYRGLSTDSLSALDYIELVAQKENNTHLIHYVDEL